MKRPSPTRVRAGLVIATAAVLLAGCSTPAAPGETPSSAPSAEPTAPAPAPQPTETEAPPADATCDAILPESVVADFDAAGWSFEQEEFRIGPTVIPDGLQCTWGDLQVASDHVQMYGWAPITREEEAIQQAALLAEGWVQEDDPEGTIVTENPETAVATDENGYGWTYLFGDGWVKFADTKQGILLVEWPPAG